MSGARTPNKTTAQALNQKAIAGIDTYFGHIKTLMLSGANVTPADLKATLQAEIDADTAVDKVQAQYTQQVVAAKLARSKARASRKSLKAYVLANYGAASVQMLKDLGIPVPKPLGPQTAEAKAQAAAKATATRKAKKAAAGSVESPAPAPPAAVVAAASKP